MSQRSAPKDLGQISYYNASKKYSSETSVNKLTKMHGVKRVLVFCVMTAVLPTLLIITPLYLRNVIFADVTYPVAESDVLAIKEGISSIFCQEHTLKMNSSFNAFRMQGTPQLSGKRKHIRLKKSMTLPDDTLEYWGFYLLKGALVKLKVCSRYEGSRILVVRGDKNLKTCGLLDHNMKKTGPKMDVEHSRVKVTFENAAEVIGFLDTETVNYDNAAEEQDDSVAEIIQQRIEKGRERFSKINSTQKNHKKRHLKHKVAQLKKLLEEPQEKTFRKRSVSNLDAQIKHGGNNQFNKTLPPDSSVSSFEMDLLMCYNRQILLTESFPPSHTCKDVHYLEKSNHMMTVHEVASDGYYYYIFYSDNDYVKNDMHAIFDIYKPTYHYANNSKNECVNQTKCSFEIPFFSDELVIVEVPTRDGIEHEADDITLLISTCHPRMAVYIIFPVSVLFLILGCAFL